MVKQRAMGTLEDAHHWGEYVETINEGITLLYQSHCYLCFQGSNVYITSRPPSCRTEAVILEEIFPSF